MMRILFVGFPYSVHAARWVSLLADQGFELHFFPSQDNDYIHPDFRNIVFWLIHNQSRATHLHPSVTLMGAWSFKSIGKLIERSSYTRHLWLKMVIEVVKPDIVHSMEFQHAGYLTLQAYNASNGIFPPWIASNWGCDIHLYGRLPEHKERVTDILSLCSYYSCECNRDIALAKGLGLRGIPLPVVPNSGGLDMRKVLQHRSPGLTSDRRIIVVKGYHRHLHRAQVALRALEICADTLKGYTIKVFSPYPREIIEVQAELITQETGIDIELLSELSHDEMLKLHGSARMSISLSISDGICTSLLEAMAMGSFPIQSWTACANEWVEDGITAALVHPEDSLPLSNRIREILLDDKLVNSAAELNLRTIEERADKSKIKQIVIDSYYHRVFQETQGKSHVEKIV